VVWLSFVLLTWYQHPVSNQQCQSTVGNTQSACNINLQRIYLIVSEAEEAAHFVDKIGNDSDERSYHMSYRS